MSKQMVTTTPEERTARVRDIVIEQLALEADEVTPRASFVDDLGADSLDLVELVMALEEEFKLDIPDDDIEDMATVGQLTAYIEQRVTSRP